MRIAHSSAHANKFGDFGMWASVEGVFVVYMVPLIIYVLGNNFM